MNEPNPNLGPGTTELLNKLHVPLDKVGSADNSEKPAGETAPQQEEQAPEGVGFCEETVKPKSITLHRLVLTVGTLVLILPLLVWAISEIPWHRLSFDFGSSDPEVVQCDSVPSVADTEQAEETPEAVEETEESAEETGDYGEDYDEMENMDKYEYLYETYIPCQRLTEDNIYGWSSSDLRILRNMIYAKHGYIFHTSDMKAHFSQYSWYTPTSTDVSGELNEYELYNVSFIKSHE